MLPAGCARPKKLQLFRYFVANAATSANSEPSNAASSPPWLQLSSQIVFDGAHEAEVVRNVRRIIIAERRQVQLPSQPTLDLLQRTERSTDPAVLSPGPARSPSRPP
jgi:hypothetical protein